MVGTNCYLVYREDLKKAVIVDPGDNGAHILNTCRECGIIPEAVVLTHGHFDHILAVEEIRRAFKEITVYAAEKEAKLLGDPRLNLTGSYGTGFTLSPDHLVKDGGYPGACRFEVAGHRDSRPHGGLHLPVDRRGGGSDIRGYLICGIPGTDRFPDRKLC